MERLFIPLKTTENFFKNRVVMAPMTRGRATNPGLVPNELMAQYYAQRAGAGLQITEGTWISPEAIAFPNCPGLFSEDQVEGWQRVTHAVHENGGKIFAQIAHCGPIANGPGLNGQPALAPSAVNPNYEVMTPQGPKPTDTPRAMTGSDIQRTIADYKAAAKNAKLAGFDGVELHGGVVYLIPSFFHQATNQRTDEYGGSHENRARFVLEVLYALVSVWGPDRVGLKLSPSLILGAFLADADTVSFYDYLVEQLNHLPLAHLHLLRSPVPVDGTPFEPIKDPIAYFRPKYKGLIIAGGGLNKESAESVLAPGGADLVAFGKAFISNPDLVARFKKDAPLNPPDPATFTKGGENGYTTYPALN